VGEFRYAPACKTTITLEIFPECKGTRDASSKYGDQGIGREKSLTVSKGIGECNVCTAKPTVMISESRTSMTS